MESRHRCFNITLNEVSKWPTLSYNLKSYKSLNYLIAYEEEAPTTGHKHIHCFVQFNNSVRIPIKKLCGAHIEVCKGSPQQNVEYVSKDGKLVEEFGELKKWGGITIHDVKCMSREDREELPFAYYDKLKRLMCDESNCMSASAYFKKVEVYYFCGPSGVGKTRKAVEKIAELAKDGKISSDRFNEVKYCNGFWIGVENNSKCEVALYDDFRDSHMPASEFINFIDYNIHNMNIKNGHIKNEFKYILITSIQKPDDLYPHAFIAEKEPAVQWMRRMSAIYYLDSYEK